jgi:hypothetical protein
MHYNWLCAAHPQPSHCLLYVFLFYVHFNGQVVGGVTRKHLKKEKKESKEEKTPPT